MSGTGRVVYETSSYPEAVLLKGWLESHEIPCELLNVHHSTMSLYGAAVPIRLLVPDSLEARARILIERRLRSPEAEPDHGPQPESHERAPVEVPPGYELRELEDLPPLVSAQAPDARGYCKACRSIFTRSSGPCGDCGAALFPLVRGARLCPQGTHVASKLTDDAVVCSACKAVWPLG